LLAPLRGLATRFGVGPTMRSMLAAAKTHGIPCALPDAEDDDAFQFGFGGRKRRVRATITGRASRGVAAGRGDAGSMRRFLAALFPGGADGRIPLVAITGTNGKTTTTLLIDRMFRAAGFTTGVAASTGVYVDGRCIEEGDCTGYWSARKVLGSRKVEAAILETARGGILKRGLGFDRCDVAVVLNVTGDHLGLDGVDTVEEMARVKRVVARASRRAVVLNAEDAHCVAMAARVRRGVEVVYFSLDQGNAVLQTHLAEGGRAVYLCQGDAILATGTDRRVFFRVDDLAVALRGRARHNVANVLAAVAAAVAQGQCPDEAIISGMQGFRCSTAQNP
ncbi:MAG: Mur ligase family protein, partial [Gammaproteobacteria bacterium]